MARGAPRPSGRFDLDARAGKRGSTPRLLEGFTAFARVEQGPDCAQAVVLCCSS
jgi:hypothetical protein